MSCQTVVSPPPHEQTERNKNHKILEHFETVTTRTCVQSAVVVPVRWAETFEQRRKFSQGSSINFRISRAATRKVKSSLLNRTVKASSCFRDNENSVPWLARNKQPAEYLWLSSVLMHSPLISSIYAVIKWSGVGPLLTWGRCAYYCVCHVFTHPLELSVSEAIRDGFTGWWGCWGALFYSNGACSVRVDSSSQIHIFPLTQVHLVPRHVRFIADPQPPANTYTPNSYWFIYRVPWGVCCDGDRIAELGDIQELASGFCGSTCRLSRYPSLSPYNPPPPNLSISVVSPNLSCLMLSSYLCILTIPFYALYACLLDVILIQIQIQYHLEHLIPNHNPNKIPQVLKKSISTPPPPSILYV